MRASFSLFFSLSLSTPAPVNASMGGGKVYKKDPTPVFPSKIV